MKTVGASKPNRDRRARRGDDDAGLGIQARRGVRQRWKNLLGDEVRPRAHAVRWPGWVGSRQIFAALLVGVSCMLSLSAWAQGLGRPPIITKHPQSQVAETGSR